MNKETIKTKYMKIAGLNHEYNFTRPYSCETLMDELIKCYGEQFIETMLYYAVTKNKYFDSLEEVQKSVFETLSEKEQNKIIVDLVEKHTKEILEDMK